MKNQGTLLKNSKKLKAFIDMTALLKTYIYRLHMSLKSKCFFGGYANQVLDKVNMVVCVCVVGNHISMPFAI